MREGPQTTTGGFANIGGDEKKVWIIENILKYTKSFGKHNLDFTGLYSAQANEFFKRNLNGTGFINDQLSYNNIGSAENIAGGTESSRSTLLSQMARINYSYDSRYLLTLSARRDG